MVRVIDLQGHRGARGLFPENTLEGFRAARAIGVTAFELDVAMTADDVAVVSHEPALHPDLTRGPDGTWLDARGPLIRSLPFTALSAFDVGRARPGSEVALEFPDQQPFDGARIPCLADVLAFDPDIRFTIELKTYPHHPSWTVPAAVMADAVLDVVDRLGAAGRVVIESFDWRGPRHVRRVRPAMRLAWLTSPTTLREAALWWGGPTPEAFGGSVARAVAAEGGQTWAPYHEDLTQAQIEEAHALGLAVLPWTVNAAKDVRRVVRAGVDGLITDRPDIARSEIDALRG